MSGRFLLTLIVIFASTTLTFSSNTPPVAHLTLTRRGGRLAEHKAADLTKLTILTRQTEAKYARTVREVKGNKLARRWRSSTVGTTADHDLVHGLGESGKWFLDLAVGDQPSSIEVDLDMLSPDFYTLLTTSSQGSKYNAFSRSHVPSGVHVHPLCKYPADTIHLSDLMKTTAIQIQLAMCNPSKSSRSTLSSSGSILGLGPSSTLARIDAPPLLQQLLEKGVITRDIWSLTLLDSQSGVLTLGGAIAREVEEARVRSEVELDNIGNDLADATFIDAEVESRISASFPPDLNEQFVWVKVRGAEGWWTTLMQGVWINGAKVLKNQPVLLDVQSPFILAPPLAARRFYESIPGAKRLPGPQNMFFGFPCLNRMNIAFEFGGWMFPALSGEETMEEGLWGPPGGKLSLGKLGNGTGYCVGAVVESRMGVPEGMEGRSAADGMRDVWVIGEPFFRGVGVVFDVENQKIGFRSY